MAVCTSIVCVEEGKSGAGDLLRVGFDDGIEAYWFYTYAQAMQYLNQEVIVSFRKDMLNGSLQQFINTFTVPTVVNTLDKSTNIKLYVDQVDNNSNITFSDIADGETVQGCIVFCTHNEFKSSANAVWQELIIRDKSMHTAKLRIFDYDNKSAEFGGKYVMTPLSRNKYGFQSDTIAPVNGAVAANPEIDIAISFIQNYFANDPIAMQYISSINLIEHLKETVDYEMGYGLMRLAMELSMVDSLQNVTKDVNLHAIGQAILCSYGHYCQKSVLSPSISNVFLALKFNFPDKELMICMLDEALSDRSPEYHVLQSIRSAVATILEVRKGSK